MFTLPKVDLSFRLRLQKARTAKQMSQKDLAVVGVCYGDEWVEIERESICDSRIRVWKGCAKPGSDFKDGKNLRNEIKR